MPTRRGLLIGIDAYERIPTLDGCVNDARLVRSLLVQQFGFPEANLTMLLNGEATRTAILQALDALVEATRADDIVVFQYAGHGSQMTDREGDEPSGLDSTIMPVDSEGWQGDNRDITDDEIHLRLVRLAERTRHTTLIVDACHSGTITRDAFGSKARGFPPDRRPVSALPPSPIPPGARPVRRDAGPSGWLPAGNSYVLVAGCRDEELSYEYRPPEHRRTIAHGALTYFLCRELRHASAGTTWRDVFERAAASVTATNGAQHPQIEGRLDLEVFGITDVEPMRFVAVTGRHGDSVTLGAGAALGLTVGSRWAVHPQGTKRATGPGLGEVEVTAVRAGTSEARIVTEPRGESIGAGTRAVETEHDYGDLRLPVRVDGPGDAVEALESMRRLIDATPLLRAVEGDAGACVYLLPPRRSATGGPVPQLPVVGEPTWATVGEDGRLLGAPRALGDGDAVVGTLATLARYRQALALDNTDPASALRGMVRLELLRKAPDGRWIVAAPDEGGQVVFDEGEPIAWRISNRSDMPLHVHLLDFGIGRGIELLFPVSGATDTVAAGYTFEVGTRPGEAAFQLGFPEGFPYAPGDGTGPVEGTEIFKAILTTHPVDFSFLAQGGVRSASSPPTPLAMLMRTATGAATTREARRSLPVGGEDWATVTRSIVLVRRR